MCRCNSEQFRVIALNESPSEKEGKSRASASASARCINPSMKVPPKRKGNSKMGSKGSLRISPLNESPSEKEGKYQPKVLFQIFRQPLNESPSEKEGKCGKEGSPRA